MAGVDQQFKEKVLNELKIMSNNKMKFAALVLIPLLIGLVVCVVFLIISSDTNVKIGTGIGAGLLFLGIVWKFITYYKDLKAIKKDINTVNTAQNNKTIAIIDEYLFKTKVNKARDHNGKLIGEDYYNFRS